MPKNAALFLVSDYFPTIIAPRTDELGHLLGAYHQRANSILKYEYAHARRYCEEGG